MADREQSAEELFGAALELPPQDRRAFLDQACSGTPELRRFVEELLSENERAGSFLVRPLLTPNGAFAARELPSAALPAISPRFQPTQVIANRFVVVRFIARGGMGEVYEVKDHFLQDASVALKIIRPEIAADTESSRRFEQEVILARKVVHPNLCPIYDIFRCDQPEPPFLFLTMKLLQGETLDSRLKLSNLPADEAVDICKQLLTGVAALHAAGIIHRDIKPGNVMLERVGQSLHVSLMDFGLARLRQPETNIPNTAVIAGTPAYMAPELLRGQRPTEASDIFALGIVLHQVLTGQHRLESQQDFAVTPISSPRSVHLPAYLVQAAEKFLSADPEQRLRAFNHIQSIQDKRARMMRRMFGGVLAAACVLCVLLSWVLLKRDHRPQSAPSVQAVIPLAVLPLSNQTGAEANNYVTDGLTDNLIRQLSELPRLRVMTRAAVDRVSRQDAAAQLGVKVLLRGELRRNSDGRLVLSSELSNADGTVLRSSQYMADESDLPSVQADIVHDVIQGLGIELDARQSAGAQRPLTSNPAAFQALLRGESAARDPSAQGMHAAIRNYEEAVRQDARFALAYSSLAHSHLLLGLYYEPALDHMPLARQYAEHALALDPSMREAHGALGLIHLVYDWDYAAAENELTDAHSRESAIRTLSCTAHLHLLGDQEHMRHAEEDLRRMLEFDPHSPGVINELGCVSYYAGRYADSVRYYRTALAEDPRAAIVYWGLGRSLAHEGRYREALEVLRRFKQVNGFEPPIIASEIGYTEAASGDRRAALGMVKRLEQESRLSYVDPYLMAVIYLGLRDSHNTYAWLNKAYAVRSSFLIGIATDPKWSMAHSDSRFQGIWNRMMESGHVAESSSPAVSR